MAHVVPAASCMGGCQRPRTDRDHVRKGAFGCSANSGGQGHDRNDAAKGIRNKKLERETGIEPATSSLGSWRSTAELLPLRTTLAYHSATGLTTATPLTTKDTKEHEGKHTIGSSFVDLRV